MTRSEEFPTAIDETLRRRFEDAWRRAQPISIEDALGDRDPVASRATLEELVHIEMEFAWKRLRSPGLRARPPADRPAVLGEYLARFPALDVPAIADRIAAHEDELRARYDTPSPPERSHPDRQDTVPPDGSAADVATAPGRPRRIGHYEIQRQLGAGGMGVVYLARQDSPQRLVAIKVLNPLVLSRSLLRRFEHEAQVLGRLRHPGIAQIYEAGLHDDGGAQTPYIAMEYIRGAALMEHVRLHHPSRHERLALFLTICDAVAHAHQQGVIHRDLKPGNILVEISEHGAHPKVLDFGLARLADGEPRSASLRTNTGQLLGTLQYMSPEQTTGRQHEVDTRCDIYALGAVLYELLTEHLPYDISALTIPDAIQVIRDREPTSPSSYDPALRGDLDTIVGAAIEKDPRRRYQTVAALAGDLRAFLDDRPISAHPPSTVYQLRKFARRHRTMVTAATVAVLALVTATAVSTWQAVRATKARNEARVQRDEAQRQTRIAEAVNAFLTDDLLDAANPYAVSASTGGAARRDITVVEVLDRAAATANDRFADEPVVEASVHMAIGHSYLGLGAHAEAMEQLEHAAALLERTLGRDHPRSITADYSVAEAHFALGEYATVEPTVLDVIERRRRVLGEEHPATLDARWGLSILYWFTRRLDEAAAICRDVLPRQQRVLGKHDQASLQTMATLAELARLQNRYDESERLYDEVIGAMRAPDGTLPVAAIADLQNLSLLYMDQDRLDEAEALKLELIELSSRSIGPEHPETLKYRASLATLYHRLERLDEAEALHREILDARRRVMGIDHPWTLSSQERLAEVYIDQGRLHDAEALLHDTVDRAWVVLEEDFWYRGVFLRKWGACLTALERFDEAEAALLEAHETLVRTVGDDYAQTRHAASALVELYEAWGRAEPAASWRQRADRASHDAADGANPPAD